MKVLCLGNNTELTDQQTQLLADSNSAINHGLLSDLDSVLDFGQFDCKKGYYHTSVLDLTPSRIKNLCEFFDQVEVLDQSIEMWNHEDEFYTTIQLALELGKPVVWHNKTGAKQISYWQNLVEQNSSFCIFPFIELLTNNGHTTVCCRSSQPVTKIDKLHDYATDKEYGKIRQSLLAGEKISNCTACYKLEERGIRSARQQESIEWAIRLNLSHTNDLHGMYPVYYEVRPSNVCNISCRMCHPEYSSIIEKEWIKLGWRDTTDKIEYSDFSIVDLNNAKKLYVAGGEPTAMKEFYEFLQNCIDSNRTDFEFQVNTNAVKISNKLLELGKHFSNLQYTVSIDAYKKHNDYVRWGSEWTTTIKNAQRLEQNGHKIHFNITVSLYSVFSFHKLVGYLQKQFPNSLIHAQFAENIYPFVFEFSQQQIDNIVSVTELPIYHNNNLFKSFVDGFIKLAKQSKLNKSSLQHFFNYNDTLDISRNSCLNDSIPELEQLRKYI